MSAYHASADEAFKHLFLAIRLATRTQEFALYFVECSLPAQQASYYNRLAQTCKEANIVLHRLDLSDQVVDYLLETVQDKLAQTFPSSPPENLALCITGLEASMLLDSNETYPAVLQIMNLVGCNRCYLKSLVTISLYFQ